MLVFWVTCGESKWFHYVMVDADSHLKLLPTSILDIYTVFKHIDMLKHWHMVAALHSYTSRTWLRFWCSGSLVELKWFHYVMVEADSNLKLLLPSILDIYQVFEHIDMMFIGIHLQPCTVIPTLLGSDFGVLGHLWSQHDVIMSWLRLTATSNCFSHPY